MKRLNKKWIVLGMILLAALVLRIWGSGHDLPYIYHPDEPYNLTISRNIFKTGDLNPHFFNYPSLFFYLNAIPFIPYYLVGKLSGAIHLRSDIVLPIILDLGVAKTLQPNTVLLGRLLTILFGVGLVGLTYRAGKQLTGSTVVGLLAAMLVAISPNTVNLSRFITPDTFVAFFCMLAFVFAVSIYKRGKPVDYILAGISVGLAASCKYNGVVILLPVLLAHFFRHGRSSLKVKNLYLALVFCALGFFVTTPYALLDWPSFLRDFRAESVHYTTGHEGMDGNALSFYLTYMGYTGSVVYILAILEIGRGIYARSKEIILAAVYPLVYFIFISSLAVRNDRTLLPALPFLFLLTASCILYWTSKVRALPSNNPRRNLFAFIAVCLVVASFAQPTLLTFKNILQLTSGNSREISRQWLVENLPENAKVGLESYSPYLESGQLTVEYFPKMISHDPDWYVQNGFNYLVFSTGIYGRLYSEPEKYNAQIVQYEDFFNRFKLIKKFSDGSIDILVYQLN